MVLHPYAVDGHEHLVRFPPGVSYCPMGFFRAITMLPEMVNGVLAYSAELECLNLDDCWCLPSDELKAFRKKVGSLPDVETLNCEVCGTDSRKKTYNEMSICTNPDCDAVGTDHGEAPNEREDLTRPDRLLYRRVLVPDVEPVAFTPPTREDVSKEAAEQAVSRSTEKSALDKGIVCDVCGNCAERMCFDAWRCGTSGCTSTLRLPPSLDMLLAVLDKPREYSAPKITTLNIDTPEDYKVYYLGVQGGYHWRIMCIWGTNFLLKGSETIEQGTLPGGSNDQYRHLATEAPAGRLQFEKAEKKRANFGDSEHTGMFYRGYGVEYDFNYDYLALDEGRANPREKESFEKLKALRDVGLRFLNLDPEVNRPNEFMMTAYYPH